jgi:putative pyruvate formate lyase activating enzyme
LAYFGILRPDSIEVLRDEACRASLSRYFDIFEGRKLAKFQICKRMPLDFQEDAAEGDLWGLHDRAISSFREFERGIDLGGPRAMAGAPGKSLLDLKIHLAKRILESCRLCQRRCGRNRAKGELGYCKCGAEIHVSSIFEHLGEEPELVPSGTIFTNGCTMACLHCQNWSISQWYEVGRPYSPKSLAMEVDALKARGCRNANLVGGDPTPWLPQWLEAFKYVRENIAVVWNSNSYYSEEAAKLLAGFADVYLLDFKYGPGRCAERISSAPSYWDVATRNLLAAKEHGELIVRVLVLPGHIDCCAKPVLEWIARNLGAGTRVNIMDQYRPEWRYYEVEELRRRLRREEFQEVISYAREIGLKNFIT